MGVKCLFQGHTHTHTHTPHHTTLSLNRQAQVGEKIQQLGQEINSTAISFCTRTLLKTIRFHQQLSQSVKVYRDASEHSEDRLPLLSL